jgi:hypothetical protein
MGRGKPRVTPGHPGCFGLGYYFGNIVGSSSASLPIIVSPSRFNIGFFNETSKAQNSIYPQKLANFLGIETFARETNRFIFQFEGAKNY